MILDRHLIAKGLMGTSEVVFDEPVREPAIEIPALSSHIPHDNKLIIESLIETFIKGVVSRCLGARKVVGQLELCRSQLELFGEFAAVVSLDILNSRDSRWRGLYLRFHKTSKSIKHSLSQFQRKCEAFPVS